VRVRRLRGPWRRRLRLRPGAALAGKALSPACNDTDHAHARDQMTAVERVHGVDPLFALMLAGTVYVNRATAMSAGASTRDAWARSPSA
jgi:hypothetical protein